MIMPNRKTLSGYIQQSKLIARLTRLGFRLRKGDHLRVAQRACTDVSLSTYPDALILLKKLSDEALQHIAISLGIANGKVLTKEMLTSGEGKASRRAEKLLADMTDAVAKLEGSTPAKRWAALHKNVPLQTWLNQNDGWPDGWLTTYNIWQHQQAEKKRLAGERKALRAEAKAMSTEIPQTAHFEVDLRGRDIHLYFDLDLCDLRSEKMADDLQYQVKRCFTRLTSCLQDAEYRNHVLHTRIPRTKSIACIRAMERAESLIMEFQQALLPPYYVESILCVLPKERQRWTKDGRLPVKSYEMIHKDRVGVLKVPFYDPMVIRNLTNAHIQAWRKADQEVVVKNRSDGVRKARETRKENDLLRVEARTRLDERAKKAAVRLGSPSAYPVHYLAMLAAIASRHAKEAQERHNEWERSKFYGLKERAIALMLTTPYAQQSFVPAHQPRYDIQCCVEHFDSYREERRWIGGGDYPFIEWAMDNLRQLKKCPSCIVDSDPLYYAFFCVTVGPEEDQIVLHCPYGIGRRLGFSPHKQLPRADHVSEGWDDSGFIFGRPSDGTEKMLFTDVWLEAEMGHMMEMLNHARGGASHKTCQTG